MNTNSLKSTKYLAKMGVLAAVSAVLVYLVHFPIFPAASFLEYDPADIPIILGTFAMGPGAGLILAAVASIIQGLTVSAASGWYGIVMHILACATYVLIAGNIYKHKKTKKTAIKALVLGCIGWIIIMIPANFILTPVYLQMFGMTAEAAKETVKGLIIWVVLFNAFKSGLNSLITFFLYKRVSGILHR